LTWRSRIKVAFLPEVVTLRGRVDPNLIEREGLEREFGGEEGRRAKRERLREAFSWLKLFPSRVLESE